MELSLAALRQAKTAREVSLLIEAALQGSETAVRESWSGPYRKQVIGLFPATPPQTNMWVAQEKLLDQSYNVERLLEFPSVDFQGLYCALEKTVDFLDIFRTTFEWNDASASLQQHFHCDRCTTIEEHD